MKKTNNFPSEVKHEIVRVFLCLLLLCLASQHLSTAAPVGNDNAGVWKYLQKFGYAPASESPEPDASTFEGNLRKFQGHNNLKQTGKPDKETMALINTPRCGNMDMQEHFGGGGHRRKRYVLQGSKWNTTQVTYGFINNSMKMPQDTMRAVVKKALNTWAVETRLKFTQVSSSVCNIGVLFGTREHGDGFPFDGPWGILAHTFYPGPNIGGDSHFDDDEFWTTGGNGDVDFYQVALHEFGHSLGLGHSNITQAVMYPYYKNNMPNITLATDDISGIRALYGKPTGKNGKRK